MFRKTVGTIGTLIAAFALVLGFTTPATADEPPTAALPSIQWADECGVDNDGPVLPEDTEYFDFEAFSNLEGRVYMIEANYLQVVNVEQPVPTGWYLNPFGGGYVIDITPVLWGSNTTDVPCELDPEFYAPDGRMYTFPAIITKSDLCGVDNDGWSLWSGFDNVNHYSVDLPDGSVNVYAEVIDPENFVFDPERLNGYALLPGDTSYTVAVANLSWTDVPCEAEPVEQVTPPVPVCNASGVPEAVDTDDLQYYYGSNGALWVSSDTVQLVAGNGWAFVGSIDDMTMRWNGSCEAEPEVDVTVTVEPRVLSGKVYLSVRVVNNETVPVDVQITTPYGSKSFSNIAAGSNAYQSFATRLTEIPSGTVTVVASYDDGTSHEETYTVDYDAFSVS